MTKLHELVLKVSEIESKILEAGGELSPELEAELSKVDLEVAEKVDAYYVIINRLEGGSDFWKAEADRYYKAAKGMANAADALKNALKGAMAYLGKNEVLGSEQRFVLSRTQPKLVIDKAKIPASYMMPVTELVPDKDRIKSDLNSGKQIDGAHFEESFSLRSYLNKGDKK